MMALRRRRSVSSVLGAVILAAIVFTVLIPLMIYLQNTSILYHLAVSERNRMELERIQEDLEVHATLSPDDGVLRILVVNRGSLSVNISRVYVMADGSSNPGKDLKKKITIPPLSGIEVLGPSEVDDLPVVNAGTAYYVDVSSSRGKTYAAPERPLNVTDPPYLLQISLLDMSYGENYGIRIEATSIDGGARIGCIRIEDSGSTSCNPVAEVQYYSERWNENRTFVFKVMPGAYTLTVWNETYTYPQQTLIILGNEAKIYDFGHTPPCPSGDCCTDMGASLEIELASPEVVLAGSSGETPTLEIYVVVELAPDAREIIKDLRVELNCTDPVSRPTMCSDVSITPENGISIDSLKPGQTLALKFTINVSNVRDEGDYFSLMAIITSGYGDRSGFNYGNCNYDSSKASTSVCKLTDILLLKRVLINKCSDIWGHDYCQETCENLGCEKLLCIPWVGKDRCYCVCESDVIPRCGIP